MTRALMKKKRRVLIAGAKFGEVYANAFLQPQPGLEFAGLFAQGSQRAQQLAHDFGVPLYTQLEQVPDDIDIACVVIRSTVAQGEGSQIAAGFLKRGIHVLQEHPLHPDDLSHLQSLARENGLMYWVNSVYPHLMAGRCWIDRAAHLCAMLEQRPCTAHLMTSRQLLYSALDLLLHAYGVTHAGEVCVNNIAEPDTCFSPLRLTLPGGNQATLQLQSYLDPSDPDMFSLVMHHVSLYWPSGYLTLTSSHGPVVWTSAFHDPQHANRERTMYRYANDSEHYSQPPSIILHQGPASWQDALEVETATAIGQVLQSMCQTLEGKPVPMGFDAEYQLALARLWLDILHIAPPVTERQLKPSRPISLEALTGKMPITTRQWRTYG